jgi:hypothetical protein
VEDERKNKKMKKNEKKRDKKKKKNLFSLHFPAISLSYLSLPLTSPLLSVDSTHHTNISEVLALLTPLRDSHALIDRLALKKI